jgi:hypothetical protein
VIIVTEAAVKLPQRIGNAFNTSHACAVITGSDILNLTAIFPEGINSLVGRYPYLRNGSEPDTQISPYSGLCTPEKEYVLEQHPNRDERDPTRPESAVDLFGRSLGVRYQEQTQSW